MANEFEKYCASNKRRSAGPKHANLAAHGQANRKMRATLDGRRSDYSTMMASKEDRTGRKTSGGYHRPGSWNK